VSPKGRRIRLAFFCLLFLAKQEKKGGRRAETRPAAQAKSIDGTNKKTRLNSARKRHPKKTELNAQRSTR
jgi:hypothetical protein